MFDTRALITEAFDRDRADFLNREAYRIRIDINRLREQVKAFAAAAREEPGR
jgi:hypothetical protein